MDWIFLAALAGVALACLAISYDIACQWQVHLLPRSKKIAEGVKDRAEQVAANTPESERVAISTVFPDLNDFEIQFALPVWHAEAHEVSCQTQNSLSYAVGVGRTDGEGIERTWSVLNPVGFATKEMGDGARHDAIENKVDHINFEKNINQGAPSDTARILGRITETFAGNTLARKLIVAIAERDKQVAAFRDVDSTLDRSLRRDWKQRIQDWVVDRSKPNPYCLEGGKSGTWASIDTDATES
jgi:hypothetical protein